MATDRTRAVVRALGKIETVKHDIRALRAALSRAPLWRPAIGLGKQCDHSLAVLADLEARFDRHLVVTIIGPCGSGKSTLLNALAGVDELSATGVDRPTTRRVVVFCRHPGDADLIADRIGVDRVEVRSRPAAENLREVVLVDTPDTDSVAQEAHIPIVRSAVMLSDILLCVFNAENPKTRDHVDFFAPLVRGFDGESLVAVLNRCDRLDERELKESILPDFESYLAAAWERPVHRLLCLSARSHLENPGWAEGAEPRHGFDQFDDLRRLVFGSFARGGFIVDRRVENAENLKHNLGMEAVRALDEVREPLREVQRAIEAAETRGLAETVAALVRGAAHRYSGINALLYRKLADRWVGPVGWLIAIWARLLRFASGIRSTVRSGGLLRGAPAAGPDFPGPSGGAAGGDGRAPATSAVLRKYRLAVLESWPDIAAKLTACHFDGSVRRIENALPEGDGLKTELDALWNEAMENAVEQRSRRLGGWLAQTVFNLPTVGIMAHVGWTTVRDYFTGDYLPSNYFVHAGIIILLTLFLSFFLFQVCVRLWGGTEGVVRRAAETARQRAELLRPLTAGPVAGQVEALLSVFPPEGAKTTNTAREA